MKKWILKIIRNFRQNICVILKTEVDHCFVFMFSRAFVQTLRFRSKHRQKETLALDGRQYSCIANIGTSILSRPTILFVTQNILFLCVSFLWYIIHINSPRVTRYLPHTLYIPAISHSLFSLYRINGVTACCIEFSLKLLCNLITLVLPCRHLQKRDQREKEFEVTRYKFIFRKNSHNFYVLLQVCVIW